MKLSRGNKVVGLVAMAGATFGRYTGGKGTLGEQYYAGVKQTAEAARSLLLSSVGNDGTNWKARVQAARDITSQGDAIGLLKELKEKATEKKDEEPPTPPFPYYGIKKNMSN